MKPPFSPTLDLGSFVELLSPILAQSQETMVVDSTQYIDFDKTQG